MLDDTLIPEPLIDINTMPNLDENQRSKMKRKMAACIKPFHSGWNNALWLVEFIELYKILGVSHFLFYTHNIGHSANMVMVYQSGV